MMYAGEPISVLDGIPIAVKDEIDCMPYPTTGNFILWYYSIAALTQNRNKNIFIKDKRYKFIMLLSYSQTILFFHLLKIK